MTGGMLTLPSRLGKNGELTVSRSNTTESGTVKCSPLLLIKAVIMKIQMRCRFDNSDGTKVGNCHEG